MTYRNPENQTEQDESGSQAIRWRATTGCQFFRREPGDERERLRDRTWLIFENRALLVNPNQSAGLSEGEGNTLFNDERDAVRKLANDLGPLDLRKRLQPALDSSGIDRKQIDSRDDAGGRLELCHADPLNSDNLYPSDRKI